MILQLSITFTFYHFSFHLSSIFCKPFTRYFLYFENKSQKKERISPLYPSISLRQRANGKRRNIKSNAIISNGTVIHCFKMRTGIIANKGI